jgi:hypothetical protein
MLQLKSTHLTVELADQIVKNLLFALKVMAHQAGEACASAEVLACGLHQRRKVPASVMWASRADVRMHWDCHCCRRAKRQLVRPKRHRLKRSQGILPAAIQLAGPRRRGAGFSICCGALWRWERVVRAGEGKSSVRHVLPLWKKADEGGLLVTNRADGGSEA